MSGLDERPENLNIVSDPLNHRKVHSDQHFKELAIQHVIKQEIDHEIYKGLSNQPKLFRDMFKLAAEAVPFKCPHSRVMCKKCAIMYDKQPTFLELLRSMDKSKLDDMHKKKVEALMIYDPKRHANVVIRFCSFHLANFDLDEKSNVQLGPSYDPGDPGVGNVADSSINVISLRIVKAGPDYTYPVEVYGKVIVRDEVDYKCVHLFDREKNNAQLINSEEDMLALTGPCRALVTDDLLCFEFDLKIKGKGEHDSEVQFSKGVIPYRLNQYDKRITRQLPSFQSTVKLVLQHVANPVAASVEVYVLDKQPGVHIDGKITVGTTRNYGQHMVVYDSSLPSCPLIREDGSLVLNRNLVAVQEPLEDPAFKDDEQMVLYVCFLDAGCEIEDEDYTEPELEDEDYIVPVGDEEISEEDSEGETEEDEDEEDGSEDPKNLVTLRYPLCETVSEFGSCKLKVKVKWTAILDAPPHDEYLARFAVLPKGYKSPNYRRGSFFE